jgi:hypothetical protein
MQPLAFKKWRNGCVPGRNRIFLHRSLQRSSATGIRSEVRAEAAGSQRQRFVGLGCAQSHRVAAFTFRGSANTVGEVVGELCKCSRVELSLRYSIVQRS